MNVVDSVPVDRLQQIAALLQSIEQHLVNLAPAEETLGYAEAARKVGVSERKLSDLVNSGRLIEGYHFLRMDTSVRFPPDIARRLFSRPPAPRNRPQAEPHRPKSPPPSRLPPPSGGRKKTGKRSSFNLDY